MLHPAATYQEFQPSPELAPFVKCYALLKYNLPGSTVLTDYFLPHGVPYLSILYSGQIRSDDSPFASDSFLPSHIAGQFLNSCFHHHSGDSGICGIFFHPSGFYKLFGLPMTELTHSTINIDDFFGGRGKELIERVTEAESFPQKVAVLETFLKSHLKRTPSAADRADGAIQLIRQNPQQSVDEVCRYFHVSSRHLRRQFKEKVGVGPKYYLRICRFHRALQLSHQYPQIGMQELSFRCGYFDLSHFGQDFKQFSGQSPFVYFKKTRRKLEIGGILHE